MFAVNALRATILAIALIIVGCANIAFDGGEYGKEVAISLDIKDLKLTCGTSETKVKIDSIYNALRFQEAYSRYRWGRSLINTADNLLLTMAYDMKIKYANNSPNPSLAYCNDKASILDEAILKIIETLGSM